MAKNINQQVLKGLRVDQSVGDAACKGLRAIKNRDGSIRFLYRWRDADGKLHQKVIGDASIMAVGDARVEVDRLREVRRDGDDPGKAVEAERGERSEAVVEAAQDAYTVQNLLNDYYRDKLAATKRGDERKRTLAVDLADWMTKPVAAIRRVDVQKKIDSIARRGANDTAGRVLRELRRALEHAVLRDRVPDGLPDPCRGIQLPAGATYVPRSRAFSATEWKKWLRWLPRSGMSQDVIDALLLAALTAQRTGEVMKMKWSDLHGDEWRVADRKIEGAHSVYLSAQAKALLKKRKNDSPFVFPSPVYDDRAMRQHVLVWAICETREACLVAEHWTAHDVRRSAATLMQSKGVGLEVLRRVLGHYSMRSPSDVYLRHRHNDEAKKAWALLGRTIAAMM